MRLVAATAANKELLKDNHKQVVAMLLEQQIMKVLVF